MHADLPSLEQTQSLAERLQASLSYPLTIHFIGEIGAGKTCFIRYLLQSLGVAGKIKSPTYAILETYDCAIGEVLHLDLYRLSSFHELDEIGFVEMNDSAQLTLIEWPEKVDNLPTPDIAIHLSAFDGVHQARLQYHSDLGKQVLEKMDD